MWIFDEDFSTVINLEQVRYLYINETQKWEVIAEFSGTETYILKSFKNRKDAIDYLKEIVTELNGEEE